MFDTIGGIPLHPLIVHAVVVLVPLAALLVLASALSATVRRWAGILTPITATIALALVPLATESGESLEKRVDPSPTLEEHTELGDSLVYFVLVLALAAWLLWYADRRARATASGTTTTTEGASHAGHVARTGLITAAMVLSVVAVLATSVQVFRIGHSGAQATWEDTGAKAVQSGGGDGD